MYRCAAFLIFTLLVVASSTAYSAPGDLDTIFNPLENVIIYDNGGSDSGRAVAVQDDGRIVVAGVSYNGTEKDFMVLRYDTAGSLDTGFGTGGVATYDSGDDDSVGAVAVQGDGRIVVAGDSYNGTDTDIVVLRYNSDGSLDTGFGTGGVATYDSGGDEIGRAVAVQDDGKIIVAGYNIDVTDGRLKVLRYNTDGSLDTDFGTNGVATNDIGNPVYGNAVALQADGRIVVAGSSYSPRENNIVVVLRFNIDGSMDRGFGFGGTAIYDSGNYDSGYAVALQADGRIIVAGSSDNVTDRDLVVLRYDTAGSLDTGFGTGGVATYDSGYSDTGRAVAVQDDGRIVVVGYSYNDTDWDLVVLRYDTAGSLDTGFGNNGMATNDRGNPDNGYAVTLQADGRIIVAGSSSSNGTDWDLMLLRYNTDGSLGASVDRGNAVAVQDDGRIVVVGTGDNGTDDDLAVLRYNTDGSLDTDFGTGGVATYDSGNHDCGYAVAVQNDGRIVVAGWSSNGTDTDIVVLRYSTDGSLDTGFGTDGVATFDNGNHDVGWAVALQNDGRIVIAGASNSGDADNDLVVLRYDAAGSLDTGFGNNGVATYDRGDNDSGRAVAVQDDGRIVVAGDSDNGTDTDIVVLRYNTDGSLDTGFGTGGMATYDGGYDDNGHAVTLQDDDRIIVAGRSEGGTDDDLIVLRYDTAGALDIGFGTGGVATYDSGGDDNGHAVTLQDDGWIIAAGRSDNGTDDDLIVLRYDTAGALDTGFGTDGVASYDSGGDDDGLAVTLQNDGRIIVAGYRYDGTDDDVLTVRFEGGGDDVGPCFISATAYN